LTQARDVDEQGKKRNNLIKVKVKKMNKKKPFPEIINTISPRD